MTSPPRSTSSPTSRAPGARRPGFARARAGEAGRRGRGADPLPALRAQPADGPRTGRTSPSTSTQKYGSTPEQQASRARAIRAARRGGGLRVPQGRPRPRLQHLRCAPAAALGGRAGRAAAARPEDGAAEGVPRRGAQSADTAVLVDVAATAGLDRERGAGGARQRRVCRRSARARAALPGAGHPRGALGDHERQAPDPGRPAARAVRAGAAADGARRARRRRLNARPAARASFMQ